MSEVIANISTSTIVWTSEENRVFYGESLSECCMSLFAWITEINADNRQHFTYKLIQLVVIRMDRAPQDGDYSDWYEGRAVFQKTKKERRK